MRGSLAQQRPDSKTKEEKSLTRRCSNTLKSWKDLLPYGWGHRSVYFPQASPSWTSY